LNCSAVEVSGCIDIYPLATVTNIHNCTFDRCQATLGGALGMESDNKDATLVTIGHTSFTSCSAGAGGGGAMQAGGRALTVVLDAVQMQNCSCAFCVEGGGALLFAGQQLTTKHSVFHGNSAFPNKGGAITALAVGLNSFNDSFVNNSAGSSGGAIRVGPGIWDTSSERTVVMFNGSRFVGNAASEDGGAVHYDMDTAPDVGLLASYHRVVFEGNHAAGSGGALDVKCSDVQRCVVRVSNSRIQDNSAGTSGGSMALQASLDLTGTTMFNNSANQVGGAVYVSAGGGPDSTSRYVNVSNTYGLNNAATFGGAMGLRSIRGQSVLQNCTFLHNKVSSSNWVHLDARLSSWSPH
jgi:predicted outer membrane repeat protein